MSLTYYVLAAGVAALFTFVLSFAILKLSHHYRLYPKIRARDVHTRPTPRLGGVAMFVGVLASFFVASQLAQFELAFADPGPVLGILAGALIIVVIGVADDVLDLDWLTKLAGQVIAAGVLVWQGVQLIYLPILGGVTVVPAVLGLVLSVFLIVLVMNAVNFIDGLDGLVGGVALIANIAFFIYCYVLTTRLLNSEFFNIATLTSAVLIGACVGFLPFNWHPARLFMGDSGALLIGLLMAASAISVTGNLDQNASPLSGRQVLPGLIPILLPLAVLIVPLLDFSLAVLRRLRAGKSPFSADRQHLHHRLLDMGHSHLHAVLIFYAWTTVASAGFLSFLFVEPWLSVTFLLIGLVVCSWLTFAPLTRRKAVEVAVQSADPELAERADAARFDPLDAAANNTLDDPTHSEHSEAADRAVLDALARKETT